MYIDVNRYTVIISMDVNLPSSQTKQSVFHLDTKTNKSSLITFSLETYCCIFPVNSLAFLAKASIYSFVSNLLLSPATPPPNIDINECVTEAEIE